jgi:hypothetical protein
MRHYLFTAGDRWVIDDDALLLFHRGAHPIDEAELRKAIGSQIPVDQVEGPGRQYPCGHR